MSDIDLFSPNYGFRELTYVRPRGGTTLDGVISKMVTRANLFNIRVATVFNGEQIIVEPGKTVDEVLNNWQIQTQQRYQKWLGSFQGELSWRREQERNDKEAAKRDKVKEMLKHESFMVLPGREADYDADLLESKEQIGMAMIIQFATAWAIAMQIEMREGKALADVANTLADDVDLWGNSGNSFTYSLAFLAEYWVHGEELRQWYNLSVDKEQGEKANLVKGLVINTSVVHITLIE